MARGNSQWAGRALWGRLCPAPAPAPVLVIPAKAGIHASRERLCLARMTWPVVRGNPQ